jgi:hypothetical protein
MDEPPVLVSESLASCICDPEPGDYELRVFCRVGDGEITLVVDEDTVPDDWECFEVCPCDTRIDGQYLITIEATGDAWSQLSGTYAFPALAEGGFNDYVPIVPWPPLLTGAPVIGERYDDYGACPGTKTLFAVPVNMQFFYSCQTGQFSAILNLGVAWECDGLTRIYFAYSGNLWTGTAMELGGYISTRTLAASFNLRKRPRFDNLGTSSGFTIDSWPEGEVTVSFRFVAAP